MGFEPEGHPPIEQVRLEGVHEQPAQLVGERAHRTLRRGALGKTLEERALEPVLGRELPQRLRRVPVRGVRLSSQVADPLASSHGPGDEVALDRGGEVAADERTPDLVGHGPDLPEPLRPEEIGESPRPAKVRLGSTVGADRFGGRGPKLRDTHLEGVPVVVAEHEAVRARYASRTVALVRPRSVVGGRPWYDRRRSATARRSFVPDQRTDRAERPSRRAMALASSCCSQLRLSTRRTVKSPAGSGIG